MRKFIPFLIITILPCWGEDWTTSDGKTYKDVQAILIDSNQDVKFLSENVVTVVPLAKLSPEVKRSLLTNPAVKKMSRSVPPRGNKAASGTSTFGGPPKEKQKPKVPLTEEERYRAEVYRAVGSHWIQGLGKIILDITDDEVRIEYTILSDGSVQTMVLERGTDVRKRFLNVSLKAIQEAAPFSQFSPPLKKKWGESYNDYFIFSLHTISNNRNKKETPKKENNEREFHVEVQSAP